MEIRKEDLIRINRGFGGELRNVSSLEYALDIQKNGKLGDYKKLAYMLRAILIDHVFSDGNKRTASFLALAFADENKKEVDQDLLYQQILSITKNNITEIRNIADRIKTCIR